MNHISQLPVEKRFMVADHGSFGRESGLRTEQKDVVWVKDVIQIVNVP